MIYVMGAKHYKSIKEKTINDEILIPKELNGVPIANWKVFKLDLIDDGRVYRFVKEEDAKAFIHAVKTLVEEYKVKPEEALKVIEGVGAQESED